MMQQLLRRSLAGAFARTTQLRATTRLIGACAKQAAPSVLVGLSLSMQVRNYFCAESAKNFDRVSSYESLISRISSSENISDILKIFQSNQQLFKNEHIVLSMRMMGRLVRKSQQDELETLSNNSTYKAIVDRAISSINSLNEYEALDLLFWMRKFRVAKIPLLIPHDGFEKFYSRINEFLKSKSFNFRNLVNLYYDFSFLNRNCDEICMEILKELRTDSKLLTPFTVTQILQAGAKFNQQKSNRELVLGEYVSRNIQPMLEEFDTDQKCLIFKYLSQTELQYNPPRYRIPSVLHTLRSQLKEKIDQLSETSVINLLSAYQYLPREFPGDLCDEIKEMVVVTVEHNASNIKTFFLLDFIDALQQIRRRRFDAKQYEVLANELGERLPHDEMFQRQKNFERVIEFYERGFRSPKLLDAFKSQLSQDLQAGKLNLGLLEFLTRQPENNVQQLLISSNILRNEGLLQQNHLYTTVRLYLVLQYLRRDGITNSTTTSDSAESQNKQVFDPNLFKETVDLLHPRVETLIAQEPGRAINIIKSSRIKSSFTRKELLLQAIRHLQQQLKTAQQHVEPESGEQEAPPADPILATTTTTKNTGSSSKNQLFSLYRNILLSVDKREHRELWADWIRAHTFTMEELDAFLDAFRQLDRKDLDVEHFLILLQVLQREGTAERISLRKIIYMLKEGHYFLQEFIKFEGLFKRFLQFLYTAIDRQPENVRLPPIYGLALRLESIGFRSQNFSRLLRRAYEQSLTQEKSVQGFNISGYNFALLLITHNELPLQGAKELYAKNSATINDIKVKAKIYSYILKNETPEFLQSQEAVSEVQPILESLEKNIREGTPQQAVNSLQSVLSFPFEFLEQQKDFYLKSLKEILPKCTSYQYLHLILSLQPQNVKNSYASYFPFIKELINAYSQFNRRLQFSDLVRILITFASLNCKHPSIYNSILGDIGLNFNSMSVDERIECIQAFAQVKIKQTDFFQKNLETIAQNPSLYRRQFSKIATNFFKIGYDNKDSLPDLQKIADTVMQHDGDIEEIVQLTKLILILNPDNEAELLEKYLGKLEEKDIKAYEKFRIRSDILLVNEILLRNYGTNPQTKPFAEKLNSLFDSEKYEETKNRIFEQAQNLTTAINYLTQYLDQMKVNYKKNVKINGISVDVEIPENNILLKIVLPKYINFDRTSFSGTAILHKRLYQSLDSKNKVILINSSEFWQLPDHLSRINLLVSEGIENKNTTGDYDFTQIVGSFVPRTNTTNTANQSSQAGNAPSGEAIVSDEEGLSSSDEDLKKLENKISLRGAGKNTATAQKSDQKTLRGFRQ